LGTEEKMMPLMVILLVCKSVLCTLGDVFSLVERAQEQIDEEKAEVTERK